MQLLRVAVTLPTVYVVATLLDAATSDSAASSSIRKLLALSSEHPWYFWTGITHPLLEHGVLPLPFVLPLVILQLRYFERAWGTRALSIYLAFISAAASIIWVLGALLFCFLFDDYVPSSLPSELGPSQTATSASASTAAVTRITTSVAVHGAACLLPHAIVAYRHTIPEHALPLGPLSFRVKHLPSLAIVIAIVLLLCRLISAPLVALQMAAFVAAWAYIRFVRVIDGLRGDRSETFAFVAFFPARLRPLIHPPCCAIFAFLVRLRILAPALPPLDMEPGFAALSSSSAHSSASRQRRFLAVAPKPPPTSTMSFEAERRKALALLAVEERMKLKTSASSSSATIAASAGAAGAGSGGGAGAAVGPASTV